MTVRQCQPGERLSPVCGHHCGIRSAADEGAKLTFIGHCPCRECNCIYATFNVLVSPDQPPGQITLKSELPARRVPMCDR